MKRTFLLIQVTLVFLVFTNAYSQWYPIESGVMTELALNGLSFKDANTGTVVGDGGTILRTTNGGVSFINQVSSEIPERFSLYQNYPNPFNPTTNIKFDIQKTSVTKLIIYNTLGREVATLVNEELKAGSYQTDWNGSNYSSGVYFYTLQAGDFIETKKMMLIK